MSPLALVGAIAPPRNTLFPPPAGPPLMFPTPCRAVKTSHLAPVLQALALAWFLFAPFQPRAVGLLRAVLRCLVGGLGCELGGRQRVWF